MNQSLVACRNLAFGIAALHEMGHISVRAMPWWDRGRWSISIGDSTLFHRVCGTTVEPSARSHAARLCPGETDWMSAFADLEPLRLAAEISKRYSNVWRELDSGQADYPRWFASLVAHMAVHPGALPAVLPEPSSTTVWVHYFGKDLKTPIGTMREFAAPPGGHFGTPMPAEVVIAQARPLDSPQLVWPSSRQSHVALDSWWEQNATNRREEG